MWPTLDNIYLDTSAVLLNQELVGKVSIGTPSTKRADVGSFSERSSSQLDRPHAGVSALHEVLP